MKLSVSQTLNPMGKNLLSIYISSFPRMYKVVKPDLVLIIELF